MSTQKMTQAEAYDAICAMGDQITLLNARAELAAANRDACAVLSAL